MADLVVELYGTRVGALGGAWRTFDFVPDPTAVARFGIDSTILSVAIPLAAVAVRSRKARRQIFFRELLPEGRMLARLAQQAGLIDQNVIGPLRAYGRDIAGALQIWDPDVPGEPKQPRFARAAGLTSFPIWIEEFEGVPALVIERYDPSKVTLRMGKVAKNPMTHTTRRSVRS